MSEFVTIGWREWVVLPDWGINIRAKADTGARSSAIDCAFIEELPNGCVRFAVRLSRGKDKTQVVEAPIAKQKHVRSSTGQGRERYFVETTLELAGRRKKILVSLTSRKKMIHRMLLGREALSGDFLVDSSVDHWATAKKPISRKNSSV